MWTTQRRTQFAIVPATTYKRQHPSTLQIERLLERRFERDLNDERVLILTTYWGKGMSASRYLWITSVFMLIAARAPFAQEVRYTYDADGRLVARNSLVTQLAITAFAPAYGSTGTAVSIQGQGFDPVASNNHVSFGDVTAVVQSAEPDVLVALVPTSAVSGTISVAVSGAQAHSAADFVVLPSGPQIGDLAGGTQVPVDGTFHPYSSLAGRPYALSFHADSNDYVSVDLNHETCTGLPEDGLSYSLYAPSGSTIGSGSLTATQPTLLAPSAAIAGTYTLLISSPHTWTCSLAAQKDKVVHAADSPIHLATHLPYHKARILFDLPEGGAFGVGTSELLTFPDGGAAYMTFFGPSDESAGSYPCGYVDYSGGCQGQIVYRPPGRYAAVLEPYDMRTKTIDTQFWLTDYVDGGTFSPNSTAHPVIDKPGQVVRYTFQGRIGQLLRLIATDRTFHGVGAFSDVLTGKNPAGTCIFEDNYYCSLSSPTQPYDFAKLQYDGIYTLFYFLQGTGAGAPTGSVSLTLSDTIQVAIPSGDNHVSFASTVNAQQVRVPIEVNPAEDISVSLTDVVSAPTPFYINADLLNPDDQILSSFSCGTGYGSCFTTLQGASPGTYHLVLKQADTRTETFSAKVWRVPFVDAGVLPINSTATVSTTLPGEVVRYTVAGTQGDLLHFYLENAKSGTNDQRLAITGKNPAGQCFFDDNYYCGFDASSYALYEVAELRLTGNYSLLAYLASDGNGAASGTGNITLSSTKVGSSAPGEWSAKVAAELKGQAVRSRVPVQEGESFTLALTDVKPDDEDGLLLNVYSPEGSLARSFYCGYDGACSTSILNATAGNYTVEATSLNNVGNTFSATLWKSEVVDGGAMTPGVARTVAVARPGNLVKLSISGSAGKTYKVELTNPIVDTGAGRAGISGRGPDGECTFADNYDCDIAPGEAANVGPLSTNATRDIYFYVSGNGKGASTGEATVIVTALN